MALTLHSGILYWPDTATESRHFDEIWQGTALDLLIVGGGMSGALSAYRLAQSGYRVALIEQHRIASGSTAANTGLIQYMSDMGIDEYTKQIGAAAAEAFYAMSRGAIDTLIEMHRELHGTDASDVFKPCKSMLLATQKRAVKQLKQEEERQERQGLDVAQFDKKALEELQLDAYWGLETSPDIALNPYRWVIQLLQRAREKHQLQVYERTRFISAKARDEGGFDVELEQYGRPLELTVPRILYATGYAPPSHLEAQLKNIQLYKSYVVVSQAHPDSVRLPEHMIWEKKDPYTYFRAVFEPRIMIGGLDRRGKHIQPRDATKKQEGLIDAAHRIMPQLDQQLAPVYSYAAIFGESRDQLPYMGALPDSKDEYVVCGLGGNGTVYSTIASDLVLAWMQNRTVPYAEIFAPGR